MTDISHEFPRRLQSFEQDGDVEPLVELFTEDAQLSKLDDLDSASGRDGARQFWTDYRNLFSGIASTFSSTTTDGERVVLEWVSQGKLTNGRSFRYPGVSVLDVEGDRVRGFRTYYDSAAFVAPRAGDS
jgi:ketosteroid isomerase-like protein